MNLTRNPAADLTDATEIKLDGVTFLVPRLFFRQTSKIQPRAYAVLNAINRQAVLLAGVEKDEAGNLALSNAQAVVLLARASLSEDESEQALSILLAGVSLAHPHVTLDDLWGLRIKQFELIAAVRIVLEKADLLADVSGASPGEAGAASR